MKSPNILFIHVDQQRYDCLGFTGHPLVKTPNLDRLRSQGMSFSKAFTPIPLCCPARQTLLSGVMPEIHGGLWNYDSQQIPGLSPEFTTWTGLLKEKGYSMAYFGKWHVSPDHDPTAFGYDRYQPENLGRTEPIKRYAMPENPVWPHTGYINGAPLDETPTHAMATSASDRLITFAARRDADGTPWHVRFDLSEPHLPCIPAEPFASMYKPENIAEWPSFRETFENKPFIQKQQLENWCIEDWTWDEWSVYVALYFGIISQVDDAIGRVLDALERSGQSDDTVVIYTTDHGDAAGSHRMMDKHYVMYEEEVHVPLLVRWPGRIEPNSTCDDFVSNCLDLGPTILEACGMDIPDTFQGKSFFPQLRGENANDTWPVAFATYHGQQFGLYDMRMVRDERYKYVYNPTDVDEFYDLQEDPAELVNLAGDEIDKRLGPAYRKMVLDLFSSLDDKLMTRSTWVKNWLEQGKESPGK